MMLQSLNSNTGELVRFILRRERFRMAVWFVCVIGSTISIGAAFAGMFESEAERQALVPTMENPAMIAMIGPVYGIDHYTLGALMANEMFLFTIIAVAIMNIFFVSRYTRDEEEQGRTELIRSLPVGRLTGLNAAVLTAVIMNAGMAVLTGVGLYALGIDSMGFEGSMLYGVGLGVAGLFFAAVTAVFAQLCTTSRGTVGYATAALGILYLLRALGDMSSETLARISPLGLVLRTQVYVENNWWPIWVIFIIAVVIAAIAYYLNYIRDMGQGLLSARPGRKTASAFLGSPFGLGMRLLRSTLIAWAIGLFILGASYGAIMGDLESFLSSNAAYQLLLPDVSGFSMSELFMSSLMSVFAMVATIPGLIVILKLNSEERHGRIEHFLGRAVSRYKLMGSYLLIGVLSSLLMHILITLGAWMAAGVVMEEAITLTTYLKAELVYLPATFLMIALTALLIGAAPRAAGVIWAFLTYSLIAVYMGDLLQLPDIAKEVTPFGNVPQYPAEEMEYAPLIIMTILAVFLTGLGMILYRRRDVRG